MFDKMLATYTDLMTKLDNLPTEIGELEDEHLKLKQGIAPHEAALESRRIALIFDAGGWAALGKNEGERAMAETKLLNEDKQYQRTAGDLAALRWDIDHATQAIKDAERQYGAVCYQAKLTAAFLGYIAGAGSIALAQPNNGAMGAEEVGL